MTHDEIKAWIKANIERKARDFGLPHWRISVVFPKLDPGCDAYISRLWQYERATVSFDLQEIADTLDGESNPAEKLEQLIEHELMHLVHSPFDLFVDAVKGAVAPEVWAALVPVRHQVQELVVCNMERMAYGIREAMPVPTNSPPSEQPE